MKRTESPSINYRRARIQELQEELDLRLTELLLFILPHLEQLKALDSASTRALSPAGTRPRRLASVVLNRELYVLSKIQVQDPSLNLTTVQKSIIDLIADGVPDRLILRRLRISPSTLKEHLKRLFRRFNVHTRAALVSRALVLN